MKAYKGQMSYSEDMVQSRLNSLNFAEDRYKIHKGFIQDVLTKDASLPTKVSFAYVDFDLYEPIKMILQFLCSTLVSGGIIIVDDYDFFSSGAKKAVDEFLDESKINGEKYSLIIPNKIFGKFSIIRKDSK